MWRRLAAGELIRELGTAVKEGKHRNTQNINQVKLEQKISKKSNTYEK